MQLVPIKSLGLVTSTTTAARVTAADGSFSANDQSVGCHWITFQWISGTVTLGGSTVTTARVGAFGELDTGTRVLTFRASAGQNALPIKDFWCVGSGTMIVCYGCA